MEYERVLVTGASGFVGSRVVEQLTLAGHLHVRAGYHRAARAARIARLGVELVATDLLDPQSLRAALEGCDAVVHCAYGTEGAMRETRAVTVRGTATLAALARSAGVRRFVHLSSVAVWGFGARPPSIDETLPPSPGRHAYASAKAAAEDALSAEAARGLPVVVLRPTNVFGPHSRFFTVALIEALRAGGPALIGDGRTPANTVYVDNLVAAVIAALKRPEAVGETFIVSDDDGGTWRDLYEAYAAMGSPPFSIHSITEAEHRALRARRLRLSDLRADLRALARSPEAGQLIRAASERPALRRAAGRLLRGTPGGRDRVRAWGVRPSTQGPSPPAPPGPSPELAQLQLANVRFRSDKLRKALGWEPPVPFAQAMRLTEEWLRFSRLP